MNPYQVVRDFESALCEYTGAKYAVTTTSCTIAITLAIAWNMRGINSWMTEIEKKIKKEFPSGVPDSRLKLSVDLPLRNMIEIPKRTYIGVPYAIREAGCAVSFRDEKWEGWYQLNPLPIWDSARYMSSGMMTDKAMPWFWHSSRMVCLSFHWSKTLGIQQGGAILHEDAEADAWLRRARFDGRTEGKEPSIDNFILPRAWHAYMSPEIAAEGLVRLSLLAKKNLPQPWGPGTTSDYPDLSKMRIFQ